MKLMILGLTLFLGLHILPTAPRLRNRLVVRLGEKRYRGLFALGAAVGLVLIIAGYSMSGGRAPLFAPFPAAHAAAPFLVSLAFVLFAAANMKTHIRKTIGHPMLLGLLLWSGVHLLANGDLAGTVLFGSFFAYALVALVSAIQRRAVKLFDARWSHDAIAVISGIVLALVTIRFHPAIFGTGPVA